MGTTSVRPGAFFEVQSLLTGEIVRDPFPHTPYGKKMPLMRFECILHKQGDRPGVVMLGSVVTHLSLEDWCEMNGYKLVQSYPLNDRIARSGERTNLF